MSLENEVDDVNTSGEVLPEPRELKRSIVKEELVALTGNLIDAVILNHLIRCQSQSRQIERFIEEERERLKSIGQELGAPPTRGWFYKKATELSEETMVGLAESNIRTRLKKMIAAGWVMERNNPYIKWDKTKQYRVDIRKISADLETIGYSLDGWLIARISDSEDRTSKTKDRDFETESRASETEVRECGNERAIPSTYITSSSLQDKNNIQDVVDSSTSLNSVLSESEASQIKTELIQLRVSPDRAEYLIKTHPDRVGQAARWWRANPEYHSSRNAPGGAVAASITNPEKYPQVYEAPDKPAAPEARPRKPKADLRTEFAGAYERVWNSLSATLRAAVINEGKNPDEYLERHHSYELSTAIISQRKQNEPNHTKT